jgi:DNA repair exonuclease SbcCD ATPase subunit
MILAPWAGYLKRVGESGCGSRQRTALAIGALLVLPTAGGAQSLADAAAKERERRQALGHKSAPHTFTERDLRSAGAQVSAASQMLAPAPTPPPPTDAAEEPEVQSDEDERQDRLEAWRQMLQGARADVARLSAEVARLEAQLGEMSGLYGAARSERKTRLERAKQDLAQSRQAIEGLNDAGRRQGFREEGP